jgi:hypothetical protein
MRTPGRLSPGWGSAMRRTSHWRKSAGASLSLALAGALYQPRLEKQASRRVGCSHAPARYRSRRATAWADVLLSATAPSVARRRPFSEMRTSDLLRAPRPVQ